MTIQAAHKILNEMARAAEERAGIEFHPDRQFHRSHRWSEGEKP